jgi:hypothetical protein
MTRESATGPEALTVNRNSASGIGWLVLGSLNSNVRL